MTYKFKNQLHNANGKIAGVFTLFLLPSLTTWAYLNLFLTLPNLANIYLQQYSVLIPLNYYEIPQRWGEPLKQFLPLLSYAHINSEDAARMVVGFILVSCYSVGLLRISGERHLHEAWVCFRSSVNKIVHYGGKYIQNVRIAVCFFELNRLA